MEKEFNKDLKLIAKSSLIVLLGVGLSKILTYVYRIIIARYFGPEIYGLLSLALMASGILIALSSLGLPEGILRYVALFRGTKQLKELKYTINFALKLVLILSVITAIFLFIFAQQISLKIFHNADLAIFLKIFSFTIPLTVLSNVFLSILRSFEKIASYSFVTNIVRNLSKAIFLFILIFLGLGSNSVALSHVFGILIMLWFAYSLSRKELKQLKIENILQKEDKRKIARDIFSYSWPILFVSVLQITLSWIDSFFLGYFKGVLEVGLYAAAMPIAMLLYFVPEIFMQLFFPLITKSYASKNIVLIEELSKQVGKWIFIVNLPIFMIIMIFPHEIIHLIFGPQYIGAGVALRFLSIGLFITTIAPTICYHLLLMGGKSKVIFYNTLTGIILNSILNIIFIPMKNIWIIGNETGINGAAIATMISLIAMNIIILFETKKYLSIVPLRRKMIRILFASIIPLIILIFVKYSFKLNLFSTGLISCLFILLYILFLLIFKCFDKNDNLVINALKNKIYRRKLH
ncbi:MAG: flippase [Nanoarchaeota archaeon]|nr:flippase [Nanoarchaeota archaeon]